MLWLGSVRAQDPYTAKPQPPSAYTILQRPKNELFKHLLLLAAEGAYVYADNLHTMETLVGILVAYLTEVGREVVDEQMEGAHLLFVGEMDMCLTKEDGALILCGEIAGKEMGMAHHTQRYAGVLLQSAELSALRGAMDVNGVLAVPDKIHGDAIAATLGYHAENAVFAGAEKFYCPILVEQAVLSPYFFIYIFHVLYIIIGVFIRLPQR